MSKVKCLECGCEFFLTRTHAGTTNCPKCQRTFETDEEVNLTDEQINRCDEIYNAVLNLCQILTEDKDLEWDMEYLGDITDYAVDTMVSYGKKVRYPGIVTDPDGSQHIEEYITKVD